MKTKNKSIILIVAIAIAMAISIGIIYPRIDLAIWQYRYNSDQNREISDDEILLVAHPDPKGEAIDSLEPYNEDESWAIYMYVVASNLEAGNINNLSETTKLLVSEEASEIREKAQKDRIENISKLVDEVESQNLSMPQYFFLPTEQKVTSADNIESSPFYMGSAMKNINDMKSVALPQNIKVVLQTGGANAWSDAEFNPNRIERFLYDLNGFRKIESNHIQNMADPNTLSDFLKFCTENYDADHKMIILWNHGGGPVGYGQDQIYGNLLSLEDMRAAFSTVFGENPETKPFDILGFDACLMANAEVISYLYPFATYLVASEEVEPGDGWDYKDFFSDLAAKPNMNAVQLGKTIVDGYASYYAKDNIRNSVLNMGQDTTLSLIDMDKGKEAYDLYADLALAVLEDATKDLSVISKISSAGTKSIIFGQDSYDEINLLDLGSFMENIALHYPNEANAVLDKINEAVLYKRGTSYGNYASGISIYYPLYGESVASLNTLASYIYNISKEEAINALYFYKIAGCLSEEFKEFALEQGFDDPVKLNTDILTSLASGTAIIRENEVSQSIIKEQYDLIQYATPTIGKLESDNTITYLGEGGDLILNEDKISYEIDGLWVMAEGHPLNIKKISQLAGSTKYRSSVIHNGVESYLILNYEDGEIAVLGVIPKTDATAEYITVDRVRSLSIGDRITAIYPTSSRDDPSIRMDKTTGGTFRYRGSDSIKASTLEDGSYVITISLYDFRGDAYYTPAITFNVKNGKVCDIATSSFDTITVG